MTIDFTLVKPMSYLFTGHSLAGEGGFAAISLDGPPGLGWVAKRVRPDSGSISQRGLQHYPHLRGRVLRRAA